MLIIALVLALVGLAALVFAVVTSNEVVAWVCIGASMLGVVLLIVDGVRERQRRVEGDEPEDATPVDEEAGAGEDVQVDTPVDYPEETAGEGEPDVATEDPIVIESTTECTEEPDSDLSEDASEESAVSADESDDSDGGAAK